MNQVRRAVAVAVRLLSEDVYTQTGLSPATLPTELPKETELSFGRYHITIFQNRFKPELEVYFQAIRYLSDSPYPYTTPIYADSLGEICACIKYRELAFGELRCHKWLLTME